MSSRDHQRTAQTVERNPPQALAVVERLQAQFPDAGVSLGPADSAFDVPEAFWADGGAGIATGLAYQDCFAIGMTDRIRAAHLIAFYGRQLSVVLGAFHLGAGFQVEIAGIRFEDWSRLHQDREVVGKRYHFRLDRLERPLEVGSISAFERRFTAHLAPIITVLKKRTGLSSGAQWRLAADALAGAFLELGRALGDEARGMAEALAIVKRRGSRLFSEELCYEEITASDPAGGERLSRQYRIRCGCCLYFRTEGGSFCDTCVLLEPADRRARLAAHLMQNGGA
ncbi:(2Fe-2S)-binding protein [Ensifer adhaerens]|uniref:(2Fe-2S)-binding protein n=1 Tax=Ensifer adhaerens TaxID=106592 RepID=UPI0023A9C3FA|nr:(2Fe-2S)-binding protein [Ensifer adhaerens]WDZ75420.1 (2Fe-2S)-binding protein [Ensifer adhaerens]